MIHRLVDLALNNRFIVLSIATLLFAWGIISFENSPWRPIQTLPMFGFR
jgi:heavy metal efflux system protein